MPDVTLGPAADIPANSSKRIDTDGHRLVVVHIEQDGDEAWYVLDDRCSHAEASLAEGEVRVADREIECPLHGSVFELESGRALTLPATKPQGTYPVRIEAGDLVAELPGS